MPNDVINFPILKCFPTSERKDILVMFWCTMLELGGTQIFKSVRYFIKYHGINSYLGILSTHSHIQTSSYKYSNKSCLVISSVTTNSILGSIICNCFYCRLTVTSSISF